MRLKIITQEHLTFFILMIASASVITAWIAEYIFGLHPCTLCYYQRYEYMSIIALLSLQLFILPHRFLKISLTIVALIFLATALTAAYQVAVENHWVTAPNICKGSNEADSFEEFRETLMGKSATACDQVQWALFGISMAGYNFILSLGLSFLCFFGIFKNEKKKKFARR